MLEQKSHCAGLGHVFDICVITVCGESEYFGAGDIFENLTDGFQTIEQRHRDVHDDHCGTKFFDHGYRLAAVLRFADHFEVVLQFEQLVKPLTHNPMVFHQQNGDSFHGLSIFV